MYHEAPNTMCKGENCPIKVLAEVTDLHDQILEWAKEDACRPIR